MSLKKITLGAALGLAALAAHAQSVHNGSQVSALSTAGLSAAVAFVPLSVAIGGSQFSVLTAEHFSRLLSEETDWIIEQVTGKGPQTELQLRAKSKPTVVVVSAPTATVVKHRVDVHTHVRFEQLGAQSYALKAGDNTLGVMAPGASHMGHSVQR